MLRSKSFRALLILVFIGGIAAIVLSLLIRTEDRQGFVPKTLLSEDISRRSTGFEYAQLKGGQIVFKVYAETSTLDREGIHRLERVSMLRFDPSGEATDAIEANGAVYDESNKRVEFEDDVVIRLLDGTEIFADWAGADLATELVTIRDSFRFLQEDIEGQGRHLLYSIPDKKFEVRRGLRAEFPSGSGPAHMVAELVVYDSVARVVELERRALVWDQQTSLGADRIEVLLNSVQRIESLEAVGKAELEIDKERRFWGNTIKVKMSSETEQIVEVLGTNDELGETFDRASYQEKGTDNDRHLESRIMKVDFRRMIDPEQGLAPTILTALQDVVFRSSGSGIEDCQSDYLEAHFGPDGVGLESVHLKDHVKLVRRPRSGEPTSQEVLRSDALDISFGADQILDTALATGLVDLELSAEESFRYLIARESLELLYEAGVLVEGQALGDCVLSSIHQGEREVLRAPEMKARFEDGRLSSVRAYQGVDLEIAGADGSRHSSSRELDVIYEAGVIREAIQSGAVRIWQGVEGRSFEILADRAEVDPSGHSVRVTGASKPVLKSSGKSSTTDESITRAKEFLIEQEKGLFKASGKVETVFSSQNGPVVVTSEEMEADLGQDWIDYTSSPRLIQGENLITGNAIRVNTESGLLYVRGNVESTLVQMREGQSRQYKIQADEFCLMSEGGTAIYEGHAKLQSEDLVVKAPKIELFFTSAASNELERVEATGGVEITEAGRKWEGRKATFFGGEERVVVSNE